jgi:pimeloyl-ACP methyl ester carboxylesterase
MSDEQAARLTGDDIPHETFDLPSSAREVAVAANGVRLHVVEAGAAGPVVLLLHGFPEFWYSWRQQIPALSAGRLVVAPDLRGYNLSDKPAGVRSYSLATLCDDVAALVRAYGARQADIVGHDWGGVIAWAVAIRNPDLVRRLAILNAPHPGTYSRELRHLRQLRRSWYAAYFQLPRVPEWSLARNDYAAVRALCASVNRARRWEVFSRADIDRYVAAFARPGAATAAINYYRALVRTGWRAISPLRRIEAPTLVLWGERDPALGVELLNGLDRWVSRLQIQRFPTAGHWVNQERPDDVTRALDAFLS